MQGFNAGSVYYEVSLDTRQMLREAPEVDRTLRGVEFRFGAVALAVKGLVGALALLKMARVADEARLLGARVEVAAGSIERGAEAMAELQRISARTETALAANATVFNRLNPSIVQMGGNTRDTLQIVELLGKAIKVSGASAPEAASAMTQFGQALGSGKLAGDELRSLLENAPYLMQQLAAGIGVPVGALKQLGEEGKLTADVVTAALTKAAARIDADFKKLPQTFEAAMTTLVDQLRRASEAGDTLTGTSAVLTGVAKGAAQAVGLLADQLGAAVTESDKLGRNDAIRSWADRTVELFSYVADAADIAWQTISVLGRNVAFVFETAGSRIGNLGAHVREVLNGNLRGAEDLERQFNADAAARRQRLDEADARTLSGPLAGERMRATIAARRVEDRGFTPDIAGSKLKAPPGDKVAAAKAAKKAADERTKGYLAEVEGRRKFEEEIGDLIKQEADKRLREQEDADELANRQNAEAIRLEEEQARRRAEARRQLDTIAAGSDPVAWAILDERTAVERLRKSLELGYITQQEFKDAEVALEQETAERIAAIRDRRVRDEQAAYGALLGNASNFFGASAELLRRSEGEQSDSYKAMFALSKGFAIAQGTIALYNAAVQAMADPSSLTLTQKLGNYAAVLAAGGNLLSTIKGASYGGGRQYGGPASAGTMYRVNETGAPEMFVGSGGKQYMLPTTSGQVVPADQVGGAGGMTVEFRVINQHAGAQVSQRQGADGRPELVISEVAAQISEHRGPIWGALSGSTNVRPRLG